MTSLDPSSWRALQSGQHMIDGEPHTIIVVDCGELMLPSGRLVAADPFVTLDFENPYYPVPPGTYPVKVTIDETIEREMYVSLLLSPAAEAERRTLPRSRGRGVLRHSGRCRHRLLRG